MSLLDSLSGFTFPGSNLLDSMSGKNALDKSYGAATDAINKYYERAYSDLGPYRSFGTDRLNALKTYLGTPAGTFTAPTMADVYSSPEFALGSKAVENSAAARGGLLSGNFLRAMEDYAGSQYGNVYNRALTTHATNLNDLMNELGIGYGATTMGGQFSAGQGNALAGINTAAAPNYAQAAQFPWEIAAFAAGKAIKPG